MYHLIQINLLEIVFSQESPLLQKFTLPKLTRAFKGQFMREIPSKRRLIIATSCAIAFLGLSFYYTTYPLGGEKAKSQLHLDALEKYNKKANKAALALIENDFQNLLEEKEGCELVVSIFASNQQLEPTRQAALKCMELGKGNGIAQEAYAMSMASVGKSADAIDVLLVEAGKYRNARIHAALAQLFVFEEKKEDAHKHLLKAIEIGKPWSPWFTKSSHQKPLQRRNVFLRNLVPLILKKENIVVDMEFRLLGILEKKGLTMEASQLKKRLHTAAAGKQHSSSPKSSVKSSKNPIKKTP